MKKSIPGARAPAPSAEWPQNLRSHACESFTLVNANFPRLLPDARCSGSVVEESGILDGDPWEGCEELADESLVEWIVDVLNALHDVSSVEKQLLMDKGVMQQLVRCDWVSSWSVRSHFLGEWCWHVIGKQGSALPNASASLLAKAAADPDDKHLSAWWKGFMHGVTLAEAGKSPRPGSMMGNTSKGVSDGDAFQTSCDEARMSVSSRASTATPTADGRLSDVSFGTPRGAEWDCDSGLGSEVMRLEHGKPRSLLLPCASPRSSSERVHSFAMLQGQHSKSIPNLRLNGLPPDGCLTAREHCRATAKPFCALPLSSLTRASARLGTKSARHGGDSANDAVALSVRPFTARPHWQ